MTKNTPTCSCPSGDGSLRWPCEVHPIAPAPATLSDEQMAFMLHNSEYPDIGCTLEEFRNGDDYDYYMKIARVALVAAAGNSQGQDMQCWAKWISRRGADLPDHACAECVPHSEMIDAGFQCVYHQAIAAMAAREGE